MNYKKIIKNIIKQISLTAFFINFLITLNFIILGTSFICLGYHNMDTAQNIRYINEAYDIELVDYISENTYLSNQELYTSGFNMIFIGFALSLYSMFSFGIIFTENYRYRMKELGLNNY